MSHIGRNGKKPEDNLREMQYEWKNDLFFYKKTGYKKMKKSYAPVIG